MLRKVHQYFAHINLRFRCLPLTHIFSQVDILAAKSSQFVLFGQILEVDNVVPRITRLLTEYFREFELSCQECGEGGPLVLAKVADPAPARP